MAKNADDDQLYSSKSLWLDLYYKLVKESGTPSLSGTSQGGSDIQPVTLNSALLDIGTTTLCIHPMCIHLLARLSNHTPHNVSLEQARPNHQLHPAHLAATTADKQNVHRCPIFGDIVALPVIATLILLPSYTAGPDRKINFEHTIDYIKNFLGKSLHALASLKNSLFTEAPVTTGYSWLVKAKLL